MKLNKKKRNNKGFTLVELIVTMAVSAIVIGAIWQFVLVSTRSYENSKADAELQQEVQQTMNQVQNLLIDTNKAVAYYYDESEDDSGVYKAIANDYDDPRDASKRLEVYNNSTKGELVWDKAEKEILYRETDDVTGESAEWESAVLAEGIESFAVDVSQVEEKQVLKVKVDFSRNNKTYTATRNIALRNDIVNPTNTDDLYEDGETVKKPSITIEGVTENKLFQRDKHQFVANIHNTHETELLWTIQGQTSDDTFINISTGEIVIGATEAVGGEITVIATLEADRTVNGIYKFNVGDAAAPTVTIVDERRVEGAEPATWGGHIPSPKDTDELVISALCGEEYKIPILADVQPDEYSHKWTFVALDGKSKVNAKIVTKRAGTQLQDYLVVENNQVEDFWLKADVVSNEEDNGEDFCYVNVIPPEPTIKINGEAVEGTITLPGGSDVTLGAEWDTLDTANGEVFGYDAGIVNAGNNLTWTITKIQTTTSGETKTTNTYTHATTDIVNEFNKIPYYDADRIEITAKSSMYPNVVFDKVIINVDKPLIELKMYEVQNEEGSTSTKTPIAEGATVAKYKWMQFETTYEGGNVANLGWKVSFNGGTAYEVPASGSGENAKYKDNGTAVWNTVKTLFGSQRMFGKTVTVTVYDKAAPYSVQDSVTFTVEGATACNLDINSANANVITRNYIHPNKAFYGNTDAGVVGDQYISNYGFVVNVDNTKKFTVGPQKVIKNGNVTTISTNLMDISTDEAKGTITFIPAELGSDSNVDGITSIIYDINDYYTDEHICFIRLNITLSNHNGWIKDAKLGEDEKVGYVALYSTVTKSTLDSQKKNLVGQKEYNGTYTSPAFCNYYGWSFMSQKHTDINYETLTPVSYTCSFEHKYMWDEVKYKWHMKVNESGVGTTEARIE